MTDTDTDYRYDILPDYMRAAAQRYVERGIAPGDFLTAVLQNDLVGAYGRADDENTARMRDWALWLRSYAPAGCWGSREVFDDWISHQGLSGMPS